MSTGVRGTLRYLAYELLVLLDSSTGHTKETDVWAFGMTTLVSESMVINLLCE